MRIYILITIIFFFFFSLPLMSADCAKPVMPTKEDWNKWLIEAKEEAISLGISQITVNSELKNVLPQAKIIMRDRCQPESTITLGEYLYYRVDKARIVAGENMLKKWKKELKSKTPYIFFQFLVVKPNEHQIEDAKKLGKELGVDDVRFKTAQIYDYENGNPLIPTIHKYSRYKKQADGTYKIKNKLANSCWKLWHACAITWDGLVVPCCFDKDAQHRLGDLKKRSFEEIWREKEYEDFRAKLIQGRDKIDICARRQIAVQHDSTRHDQHSRTK